MILPFIQDIDMGKMILISLVSYVNGQDSELLRAIPIIFQAISLAKEHDSLLFLLQRFQRKIVIRKVLQNFPTI